VGDGDGEEDRQAERGADLLTGVQESGRQAGLVLVDPGVGRRGRADEEPADAEACDQEAGQEVGDCTS
jgi:hypothetical protein